MSNEGVMANGDYTVQAGGNITIQSTGDFLHLNATDDLGGGGILTMNANSTATITCGDGTLLVGKDGSGETSVMVQASSGGNIALATGTEGEAGMVVVAPSGVNLTQGAPVVGPRINLTGSDSLALEVGPPGVGSSIELTPAGITIKFAEWSIELAPAGITMTVGPNTLTLAPEKIALNGLMIDIEGITQTALKGLQTQINGDAMVQVQGGLITLG